MDSQRTIRGFVEELARRDGSRAVNEATVRGAIKAYAKCLRIVYHAPRELTDAQVERALKYYRRRRAELSKQPLLLAA
jgi:hypothetical protein